MAPGTQPMVMFIFVANGRPFRANMRVAYFAMFVIPAALFNVCLHKSVRDCCPKRSPSSLTVLFEMDGVFSDEINPCPLAFKDHGYVILPPVRIQPVQCRSRSDCIAHILRANGNHRRTALFIKFDEAWEYRLRSRRPKIEPGNAVRIQSTVFKTAENPDLVVICVINSKDMEERKNRQGVVHFRSLTTTTPCPGQIPVCLSNLTSSLPPSLTIERES